MMFMGNGKMRNLQVSQHAKARAVERNIKDEELDLVFNYGLDVPAGSGTARRFLRSHQFKENEGHTVKAIERASRIEIIVADGDVLVTCYKSRSGIPSTRRKKRYSRKRINRSAPYNYSISN